MKRDPLRPKQPRPVKHPKRLDVTYTGSGITIPKYTSTITYPKDVNGYLLDLKSNITDDWEISSRSLPVDNAGMISLELAFIINLILPKKARESKWNPHDPSAYASAIVQNSIRDTFSDKLFDDSNRWELTMSLAEHVRLGAQGRMMAEVLGGTKLYNSLDCQAQKCTMTSDDKRIQFKFHINLKMLYYGCYVDSGRGKTLKAGHLTPQGITEFHQAIITWVKERSRFAGKSDSEIYAIAQNIWKRINKEGLDARPFLTQTLNEVVSSKYFERKFQTEFESVFKYVAEEGGKRGLEQIKKKLPSQARAQINFH